LIVDDVDVITVNVESDGVACEFGSIGSIIIDEELDLSGSVCEDLGEEMR
jgi:hypothetical protein